MHKRSSFKKAFLLASVLLILGALFSFAIPAQAQIDLIVHGAFAQTTLQIPILTEQFPEGDKSVTGLCDYIKTRYHRYSV